MTNSMALFGKKSTLAEVPKYNAEYEGAGNQNVTSDDVKTPALYVLQKTSNVIGELEGAKPGLIWNNITNECTETVLLINMGFRKSYIASEKAFGGANLGSYDNFEEAESVVKEQQNPSNYKVSDIHKHTCLLLDENGHIKQPIEVRFRGTSQMTSRDWNAKFLSSKTPRFASVWEMGTRKESNNKGEWFTPTITQVGWVPKEAIDDLAKQSTKLNK